MSNICKRSAVNKSRCALKSLNKVRFNCIFEQGSHCAGCFKLTAGDGFIIIVITDDDF